MMATRWTPILGTAALLFMAGCAAEYDERWVPPGPPPMAGPLAEDEGAGPSGASANLHRKSVAYQPLPAGKPGSSSKTATAAKATESNTTSNKPLTPAEIRTAVPVAKVPNPEKTLATAKIKSVWGDVVGQVRSVDVTGGKLAAVDATVRSTGDTKSKPVRIDAGRLKYVKSRNLLVTTLSKPDIDKLAKPEQP